MKLTTFGTLKGGVGKTMLCFNIGGILSQLGDRVLIIDSDLQGNLTNNIGIDRTDPQLRTTYDIYSIDSPPPPPEQLVYSQPNSRLPNLDMIPGSIFLHRAELALAQISGREQVLKGYIEDNQEFFKQYDHILIDTNPSMSIVNQNAFLASDSILLVSDVSMNALEGAQLFIALWQEASKRLRTPDNIKAFIINDMDVRNKISTDFLDYLRHGDGLDDIRALMLDTIIPRNVRITESELAATPISLFDPQSKGCKAITSLIEELYNKGIL